MFTVAGGILIALFVLLVLVGFALALRDATRFAKSNAKFCGVIAVLLAITLCGYWASQTQGRATSTRSSAPTVCRGSCEYR